jgi:5,5'-dehydrodivanillate O-demethylase
VEGFVLTQEQNERLTRVGPGTPMGELLRRYWYPIAAVSQMKDRDTLSVKLLGEELVLYRDLTGKFGLIAARCPHRNMSLVYGIPTECGLRCPYHGWAFDHAGNCVEQPYEDTENAQGHYKDKIKTPAYKVAQAGGLFFGYLGPDPVPVLPPWDLFVNDGVMREIGFAVVPCNWLQIMENSFDGVHVEWLHQHLRNYVKSKLGRTDELRQPQSHKKIGFDIFEHGVIKRRITDNKTEADEDWATGHPVIFPNFLKTGSMAHQRFQIRVPIDDENTAHWWYHNYTSESEVTIRSQRDDEIPLYKVPVPQIDQAEPVSWEVLDATNSQDMVAWMTQGRIADRSLEALGRSDKGIVLYRRMLEQALNAVGSGEDPMNVFRDFSRLRIDLPIEHNKLGYHGQGSHIQARGALRDEIESMDKQLDKVSR